MRRFQLFGLVLLLTSLLNCEDIKMANQRPVIGRSVGAQNAPDSNDLLLRIELAKLHKAKPIIFGFLNFPMDSSWTLLYRNNGTSPVLITVTGLSAIAGEALYFAHETAPAFNATKAYAIMDLRNGKHEELLLPGERIFYTSTTGASNAARYVVTNLNGLF